ncbi:hypothetical protein EGCR1_09045 [Enterococcus gilvus]|jgi:hypothetical protein|uniref:hypothetical protein n=1 Tax=Enterococcus gilvus TaxID=160453 RepID=UPI000DF61E78|nr:hypothetical protein [Enterococcus gilvus]AXG38846.1 hypothetical protein EGCR1_09045 [Enterococcus gilvus]
MNDYDLLKKAHNSLPKEYKEVMVPYLKSYAAFLVSGGKESEQRAMDLFKQYWVGYKIYLYQQKNKYFDYWDLRKVSYEAYRELALKIVSNNATTK